jgi:hypothetical protein
VVGGAGLAALGGGGGGALDVVVEADDDVTAGGAVEVRCFFVDDEVLDRALLVVVVPGWLASVRSPVVFLFLFPLLCSACGVGG